jgi:SAM-dependent methyltransferase
VSDVGWEWDPSLYAGSAAYYVQGRVAYTQELVDRLVAELALDGSGRLLDLGCGPGSLTLLLAPWFEHATGLDADAEMLAEGERLAGLDGITNVDWIAVRAEDLPPDLGPFRVATLAQSFHWMDRARVAGLVHRELASDGFLVHLNATTHEGVDNDGPMPYPRPPRREIEGLVKRFLGPRRRAGQGTLPHISISEADRGTIEAKIYQAVGFLGPTRILVPGPMVVRSVDEVVASVFSLSSAAPHLFGDRRQSSRLHFVNFSRGTALKGSSASRCARPRSTSGAPSRLRCTYLPLPGRSLVDCLDAKPLQLLEVVDARAAS